jgi:hypothetical protein
MRSPEAYFDTLLITQSLQRFAGGLTRLHIQRLAFLACLLAVYRNRPMADWGYSFSSTEYGTPFSAALSEAWEELCGSGYLAISMVLDESLSRGEPAQNAHGDEAFGSIERAKLTPIGEHFCSALGNLRTMGERLPFLNAACDSSLAVASSTLHSGLANEPTSKSGRFHPNGAALLSGPAAGILYRQLAAITNVLQPADNDLFTPSVTWLRYSADERPPKAVEVYE